MADEDKEVRSSGIRGTVWRALPRRPRLFKKESLSARDEASKFTRGLTELHHYCPHDGAAMQLMDVYPTTEAGEVEPGSEAYRALVCPECSFTVPASVLKERLKREAAPLKQAERQFTAFAFGIVVLAGGISLLNGSILTLLCALVLSMTLFLKALFYRYRYWQAENGRLFESDSPVKDWLREELGSKQEKANL